MTNLIRLAITGLVGLLATRSCAATPLHNSEIVRRVPGLEINWEGLYGSGNLPVPGHLLKAYAALQAQANKDQLGEKYTKLIQPGATSFWTTLHVLIKLNPDGKIIKRMFETSNNPHTVTVKLHQFADEAYADSPEDVLTDDLPEWTKTADSPLWPFVLAEAAFKTGWDPKTPEAMNEDDAEKMLEMFTGAQADTAFDIPETSDGIWEKFKDVDELPTMFFLDSIGWFVALEVTNADEKKFKIGLFPFLDTLASREITALKSFTTNLGPCSRRWSR